MMKRFWTCVMAYPAFLISIAPMPQPLVSAPAGIQLTYAIANAPPEIAATAQAVGIETFGFLRPGLYTSWTAGRKHFDADKAQRNLPALTAILENNAWMMTDLEKHPRRIVRDPDDYEPEEVKWAIAQYETMWKWFRTAFPNHKLTEWNLSYATDNRPFPLAEALVVRHLDAFDISFFWNTRPGWLTKHRQILQHAIDLGRQHDRPVIITIWERTKVWNADRTVAVYVPLSRTAVDQMLGIIVAEADPAVPMIVVFWSNTYSLLAANNPAKVIAETIGHDDDPDYDPMLPVNAEIVSLMARMQLELN